MSRHLLVGPDRPNPRCAAALAEHYAQGSLLLPAAAPTPEPTDGE